MAGVLENVDLRTKMAGQNRLELLLFQLNTEQRYGINVFKIREVLKCMHLTHIPRRHPVVCGVATIRGVTVPMIDLSMAVGGPAVVDPESGFIIITEYNQRVQGFIVSRVERIVNMKWEDIHAPPLGVGSESGTYLTAVTRIDNKLVEVIDVEKVLQEICPVSTDVTDTEEHRILKERLAGKVVLIVDDSTVARKQIARTLTQIGIEVIERKNGMEGLNTLKEWADQGGDSLSRLFMLISDVEMPEMDGYTLTAELREDPRFKDLYIVLHTSLSGVFNKSLVEKVGANKFLPKFNADAMLEMVQNRLNGNEETPPAAE